MSLFAPILISKISVSVKIIPHAQEVVQVIFFHNFSVFTIDINSLKSPNIFLQI